MDSCEKYADATNDYACVDICPAKTFLQTDGKICDTACASKTYQTVSVGSDAHDVCMEAGVICPVYSDSVVTMDGTYAHCVDSCERYVYGTTCVRYCPTDTYLQTDRKTCKTSCDTDVYEYTGSQNECVRSCNYKMFAEIRDDQKPKKCINECDDSAYETVIIDDWVSYKQCVADANCSYYVSEKLWVKGQDD